MKALFRSYLINLGSLYTALLLIKGFSYDGKIETLLFGALCFTAINWFIKPVVKILTLPLNLMTLGAFSWIVNALMIFLLTRIIPQFQITTWHFGGISYEGFKIPAFTCNVILTYIAVSFIIALTGNILHWLSK